MGRPRSSTPIEQVERARARGRAKGARIASQQAELTAFKIFRILLRQAATCTTLQQHADALNATKVPTSSGASTWDAKRVDLVLTRFDARSDYSAYIKAGSGSRAKRLHRQVTAIRTGFDRPLHDYTDTEIEARARLLADTSTDLPISIGERTAELKRIREYQLGSQSKFARIDAYIAAALAGTIVSSIDAETLTLLHDGSVIGLIPEALVPAVKRVISAATDANVPALRD